MPTAESSKSKRALPPANAGPTLADLQEIEKWNKAQELSMQRFTSVQGKVPANLFQMPPGMIEQFQGLLTTDLDSALSKDVRLLQLDIVKLVREKAHDDPIEKWNDLSKQERKDHILKGFFATFRGDVALGQSTPQGPSRKLSP